jgi:hypothetical protein
MARPTLVLASVATLLVAAPAMAKDAPSTPTLQPVPATVTSLPLAVAWTPSTFTPGSLQQGYQIRVEDSTAGATQLVSVPAPAGPGTVTASLSLIDGHAYGLRVRGVETICGADAGAACKVVTGDFGNEQRTKVALAPPPPPPPVPAPVVPAPPPPPVAAPPPAPPVDPARPPAASVAPPPPIFPPTNGPLPRWVAPSPSLRLNPAAPIRLRWRANRKASFYNVQVFAGRRKLLSVWPTVPSLTLRPGTLHRGSQRIVVWSSTGPKVAPRYDRAPWVIQDLTIGSLPSSRA